MAREGKPPRMYEASDDEDEAGDDRMRDLLASYYGISERKQLGIPTSQHSPPSTEKEMEHEQHLRSFTLCKMDSNSFESTKYVRHLLKTGHLASLMQRDDELVYDVKTLDSDMQMLVYENYNKFISATGLSPVALASIATRHQFVFIQHYYLERYYPGNETGR